MARKKKEEQTYWVPMTWEYRGGAYVKATNPEDAVAKAEAGEFVNGVDLYERVAEIINWQVIGDAKLEE